MTTAPAIDNFRLTAALAYASMGWLVMPVHCPRLSSSGPARCSCGDAECSSVGKHPLTENGLKDASSDAEVIRRWWAKWPVANVGIATGAVSGIVVLDEDPPNGGDVSLERLIEVHGNLPPTTEVETGGGGVHRIFQHPGRTVRNSASKLGKGLDIRGDGGYIVAPPSLHRSGERYAWRDNGHPADTAPAPMPGWMLEQLIDRPKAVVAPQPTTDAERGRKWLGEALAKADGGSRNDTGFWLACQLRDNGIGRRDAESLLIEYCSRCPHDGDRPAYTQKEAIHSVETAYATPARQPAVSATARAGKVAGNDKPVKPTIIVAPPASGAAAELKGYLEDVIAGRIQNVPLPWPLMTKLTQALINGSVVTICGDPGVGKTFLILQALQFWRGNDVPCSIFFIEKDRKFHTLRLLAQLEGDGRFIDLDWVAANADYVRAAEQRNAAFVDMLGDSIWSEERERLTLDFLMGWVRDRAKEGKRILVIDPITAADAGAERWRVDDDFMIRVQHTLTEHGASLILVTHSRKGNRPGAPSGHDQAGGAAYHRFADTNLWLYHPKKSRRVMIQTTHGPLQMNLSLFAQIHKARNGKGKGQELGFIFGEGLKFAEQGLVVKDLPERDEANDGNA